MHTTSVHYPLPSPYDDDEPSLPRLAPSPFSRFVLGVLVVLVFVGGVHLLRQQNARTLVTFPRAGGTYAEGVVGTPRFINPLLASSDVDRDLTKLVYAGLMARDADGILIPELAESYAVSDDGTVYTFLLKHDLTFHDGMPLTSADVRFTVEQVTNPGVRSTLADHWNGILVETPDEYTIVFTLPEAYAPFIENTTIGILPKHIWGGLSPEEFPFSQYNVTPVGAGPYQVSQVVRDTSGIPAEYQLIASDEYVLGSPNIGRVLFKLYRNTAEVEEAFLGQAIDAVYGIDPAEVAGLRANGALSEQQVLRTPYLHTYGLYFNQNRQPIFLHDEVRIALADVVPRQAIVDTALYSYGIPISTPLPARALYASGEVARPQKESTVPPLTADASSTTQATSSRETAFRNARERLEGKGWQRREEDGVYERETKNGTEVLRFSIATVNMPALAYAAELVAAAWKELGAEVEVKLYSTSDLTQTVIRPRNHEVLLFGTFIGHELDYYAFWHSSQRNDPGLNVAQFADIEADALLEKARRERDPIVRNAYLADFAAIILEERPAVMLYMPDFIYLTHNRIHNVALHPLGVPSERFDGIQDWYIEVEHLWPFVRDWLIKIL